MVSAGDAQAMDQARVVVTWMGAAVALRADPSQCGIATFPEFDVYQLRPGTLRLRCTQKLRAERRRERCGRTAMLRNILVHIPSERPVRPVIEVAIALTMARRSHLDAVAIGYESMGAVGTLVGSGGAAVAAVVGAEQERAQERADEAISVFEVEAKAGRNFLRRQELDGDPGRSQRSHRSACAALRHDNRAPT